MDNDNVVDFPIGVEKQESEDSKPKENGTPAVRPSQQTMEFFCQHPDCLSKGRKIFRSGIEAAVINATEVSSLTYVHEKGITCKYCNTYYQIGILGYQVQIQWVIQACERPAGLILAPSGLVT